MLKYYGAAARLWCICVLCAPLLLTVPVQAHGAPITFTDDTGERITLHGPAHRIITLYPGFTEILASLNATGRIIAATRSDAGTPESPLPAELPRIGTHLRPNGEMIVALAPDLVLQMHGRGEELPSTQALRGMGLQVAVFRMNDFADLFRVMQSIGLLCSLENEARHETDALQERLARLTSQLPPQDARLSVFYEIRYPNLIGAGPDTMSGAIIRAAGGLNVLNTAAEATGDTRPFSRLVRLNEENLIILNPQAYIMQQGPMNPTPVPLGERAHFVTLEAVKKGRWLIVPEDTFGRPGPRSVDAAERLARFLYPNVFSDGMHTAP